MTQWIEDKDNFRTLYDLQIRNNDQLKFSNWYIAAIWREVNFVFSDGSLTPEFNAVIDSIFERFSENGKMTWEKFADFSKVTLQTM